MKVDRPWTRKEEMRLRELIAAGARYPAAAVVLGRTLSSVQAKGCRLVGRKVGPQFRHDSTVRRLSRKGYFDWEIALELDVCVSRVQRIRARLGVPAADQRQSEIAKRREEAKRGTQ